MGRIINGDPSEHGIKRESWCGESCPYTRKTGLPSSVRSSVPNSAFFMQSCFRHGMSRDKRQLMGVHTILPLPRDWHLTRNYYHHTYNHVLFQNRIPHGYYDLGFPPTSMGGREGASIPAYSAMSDARFARTDNNASPVPSSLSTQVN